MCRMVGFCFETNQEINGFFEHLQRMAKMGKNAPHNHGWGIYALFDDAVIYYRSPKSVYEEELIPLKARVGILHARKASEHLPVSFMQLHPFIDNHGKAFCHNGTIYDIPFVSIESDTFSYFVKIKDFSSYEELAERIRNVAEGYRHTGMNFLMVNDDELIVYCGYSQNEDYYTLWYDDGWGFVVASEPMNDNFKPMENRTMLVVKDGRIEKVLRV
uniref:Glutamine amidotransferase type-2 domain-containing protein n=1 Tax=Pseudothermotoga hypogea TaxID=57487 RepID=A0A832I6J2_9THEM